MNSETPLSCLSCVMTLKILVLRKRRLISELCHIFILFLSNLGAVSEKTGRNQSLVGYNLIFVRVFCSTNGLFVLILRLFIFFCIIAYFMSSFCFLVDISFFW